MSHLDAHDLMPPGQTAAALPGIAPSRPMRRCLLGLCRATLAKAGILLPGTPLTGTPLTGTPLTGIPLPRPVPVVLPAGLALSNL
ncbi:MAG: hypothetical protein HC774_05905 [Sphingomonadales bacterium]|nr:hypothetical protein [Sphingomonadales bacterium]